MDKSPTVEAPSLAQLIPLLRPYPIKGQKPVIDRHPFKGFVTGRVHICMGCSSPYGTLYRLFKNEAPQTKRDRKSHGKPRRGRAFTLYTHKDCREESLRSANEFIDRQLQEALRGR